MYEPFEGEKSIKRVIGQDYDFFKEMTGKLGLKYEIDFVTLCAAIAFNHSYYKGKLDRSSMPGSTKLVGMDAFEKRKFYDHLVLDYLETTENRLDQFHTYFYSGFLILRDWYQKSGVDLRSELERYCGMWDELKMTKKS